MVLLIKIVPGSPEYPGGICDGMKLDKCEKLRQLFTGSGNTGEQGDIDKQTSGAVAGSTCRI